MKNPQLTSYLMEKNRSFCSKISNEARMPAFATSVQHSTWCPSQGNQAKKKRERERERRKRKETRDIQSGKEELKVPACRKHDLIYRQPQIAYTHTKPPH